MVVSYRTPQLMKSCKYVAASPGLFFSTYIPVYRNFSVISKGGSDRVKRVSLAKLSCDCRRFHSTDYFQTRRENRTPKLSPQEVILFFTSVSGETPVNDNDQSVTQSSPRGQKKVLGFLTNNIAKSQLLREKVDGAKKKVPSSTLSINKLLGGGLLQISNNTLKFNRSALMQALRPQIKQDLNANLGAVTEFGQIGIRRTTEKNLDEPDVVDESLGTSSYEKELNDTSSDDPYKLVSAVESLSSMEAGSNSEKIEVGNVGENINLEERESIESYVRTEDDDTADAKEVEIAAPIDAVDGPQSDLIVSIAKDFGEFESDVLSYTRTLLLTATNWLVSLVSSIVRIVFHVAYVIIVPFPLRLLVKVIVNLFQS